MFERVGRPGLRSGRIPRAKWGNRLTTTRLVRLMLVTCALRVLCCRILLFIDWPGTLPASRTSNSPLIVRLTQLVGWCATSPPSLTRFLSRLVRSPGAIIMLAECHHSLQ